MVWYRVILGLVTGSLVCVAGALATGAVSQAVSGQTVGEGGYAYICDGPTQVQVVKEHPGGEVVVVDGVERPNSPDVMFEVFQASHPEQCAVMAAPSTGAVSGTVLVAVTWGTPRLSIVTRSTAKRNDRPRAASLAQSGGRKR
jgi:hypothetical protein